MSTWEKAQLGVSLPSINQTFSYLPELAGMADEAGFDSVWNYEVHRNPFVIGALCAQTTQNVTLATGLAAGVNRSPQEMANAAADVDELSSGRAVVGIGPGAVGFADLLSGGDVSRPLPMIREYIKAMRAGWEYLDTGATEEIDGEFYKFHVPPFNPWGLRKMERSQIPIFVGALKPGMLRLAGSVGDGVIGYLMSARYAQNEWVPGVDAGVVKADRKPEDVDKVLEVLTSVDEDREKALRLSRINVGLYVAHPVSSHMVEYEGLVEDRDAVFSALMTDGPEALARTTSDALVKAFSITGTPEEAQEQLAEFQQAVPHVVLHTPYMPPINREESASAFLNLVKHLGRR